MNPLLQTFFIAVFGVFLLTSPAEKRLPTTSTDSTIHEKSSLTLVANHEILDHKSIGVEGKDRKICSVAEVPSSDKQISDSNPTDNIPSDSYLSKGLNKFFILIGYLTGFEKISHFIIS